MFDEIICQFNWSKNLNIRLNGLSLKVQCPRTLEDSKTIYDQEDRYLDSLALRIIGQVNSCLPFCQIRQTYLLNEHVALLDWLVASTNQGLSCQHNLLCVSCHQNLQYKQSPHHVPYVIYYSIFEHITLIQQYNIHIFFLTKKYYHVLQFQNPTSGLIYYINVNCYEITRLL